MVKKFALLLLVMVTLSSCVSKKVFEDLESKYTRLRSQNRNLTSDLSAAEKELEELRNSNDKNSSELAEAKANLANLEKDYASAKAQLTALRWLLL